MIMETDKNSRPRNADGLQFQSEGSWAQNLGELMFQFQSKDRIKMMSHLKSSHSGGIYFLLKARSAFCSIQTFNWSQTHPH